MATINSNLIRLEEDLRLLASIATSLETLKGARRGTGRGRDVYDATQGLVSDYAHDYLAKFVQVAPVKVADEGVSFVLFKGGMARAGDKSAVIDAVFYCLPVDEIASLRNWLSGAKPGEIYSNTPGIAARQLSVMCVRDSWVADLVS